MKYSIIVPCYNEEKNISLNLKRYAEFIKRDDIEIIFVNNGSKDNSEKIFNELISQYSFAKVVTIKENKGYGFGILTGLAKAKGHFLGWTHADIQTDPGDIIHAINILEKSENPQQSYIKGFRTNRLLKDKLFTLGMSLIETTLFLKNLSEINAQPNLFPRSFYESWVNPPYDFSLDLYAFIMAKNKKLKIYRFNVLFPERIYGKSSWNSGIGAKIKNILKTLNYSFKLRLKV